MHIESPALDVADDITDMWVDLAAEQREHGSHLLAEENRSAIRESVARHTVAGGLLVAREDDDVVGFVLFDQQVGDYEQDADRGLVRYIYVRPSHRGEGIGSALLERAETRLFEGGADTVALEVLATNDAARRFYRRHGYEPHRVELETESDTHSKDR